MIQTLQINEHPLPLWLLLGADSPACVTEGGLPLPEVMRTAALVDGFLARTGREEFLLATERPPEPAGSQCWRYRRGDRVLALQGPDWRRVMGQICHMDLAGFGEGDWLFASVAGVGAWCLGLADGLLIGCDPSLGDYLNHTLTEIVADLIHPDFNRLPEV